MGASSDAGGLVVPRNASSSASKTPQRANGSGSPIIAAVPSASSSPATTRFSCSRPGPRRRRRSTSAAASRSHLRRRLSMPSGHIPDQADHAPNAARTSHEGTPSQAERSSPHLEPRPHEPRRDALPGRTQLTTSRTSPASASKGRAPCVEYSSSRPEGARPVRRIQLFTPRRGALRAERSSSAPNVARISPEGAPQDSQGRSPWNPVAMRKGSPERATHQSHTYRSSNDTPDARRRSRNSSWKLRTR